VKRFLVFAPLGADPQNPLILGAIVVPDCFTPTDAFIDVAEAAAIDLFLMTGPPDAIPGYLLGVGKKLMARLSSNPRLRAELN